MNELKKELEVVMKEAKKFEQDFFRKMEEFKEARNDKN